MKLGTKIMLGFVAACVIFIILSAYIYFSLRQVHSQATELDRVVLPTTTAASDVQAAMTLQALNVLNYNYSSDNASWQAVTEETAYINKRMADLKAQINTDFVRGNPASAKRLTA